MVTGDEAEGISLPRDGVSVSGRDEHQAGLYVAGFWGPRPEDPTNAAQRLKGLLKKLAAFDPMLAKWYFGTLSKTVPPVPLPTSEEGLSELIRAQAKWTREGLAPQVAKRLGAIVGAWAGDYDVSASLIVCLGNTSERVGNSVVLNLPAALNYLFNDWERSRALLDAIVSTWDPDRAVLRPRETVREDTPAPSTRQHASKELEGWIVYRRGEPLQLGGPFKRR